MLPLKSVFTAIILLNTSLLFAGEVVVKCEKVEHFNGDMYWFYISIDHGDKGWDHYANRVELLNEKKQIFATRVFRHPHVKQRPFTRDVAVRLKKPIENFTVRGHDLVHGYGPETQCNLQELLNHAKN